MLPPPPTKKLRTTMHDYAQLSTMVDFIVLSIKLVFMVLGISYSLVLAQRPTGCCSASCVLFAVLWVGGMDVHNVDSPLFV